MYLKHILKLQVGFAEYSTRGCGWTNQKKAALQSVRITTDLLLFEAVFSGCMAAKDGQIITSGCPKEHDVTNLP